MLKMLNVLCDLHFRRNQPQNFSDDRYIGTLKKELIKLKNKKLGHCDWVVEHVVRLYNCSCKQSYVTVVLTS